jgi:hypothetical protein
MDGLYLRVKAAHLKGLLEMSLNPGKKKSIDDLYLHSSVEEQVKKIYGICYWYRRTD